MKDADGCPVRLNEGMQGLISCPRAFVSHACPDPSFPCQGKKVSSQKTFNKHFLEKKYLTCLTSGAVPNTMLLRRHHLGFVRRTLNGAELSDIRILFETKFNGVVLYHKKTL